jgi:hypothetical protein
MEKQVKAGIIKKFIIIDTPDRTLAPHIDYGKCFEIDNVSVYTFNVCENFETIEDILDWRYTTYLNCSIGKAFNSAKGKIHTSYESVYNYFTKKSYRDIVHGMQK